MYSSLQSWFDAYTINYIPFSAFGPLLSPNHALEAIYTSLSVTAVSLPLPTFNPGASDLLFAPTPSSGDLVFTVDGKGRPAGGRLRHFASFYAKIDPWLSSQLSEGYNFLRPGACIAPAFYANHKSAEEHREWGARELAGMIMCDCVGVWERGV